MGLVQLQVFVCFFVANLVNCDSYKVPPILRPPPPGLYKAAAVPPPPFVYNSINTGDILAPYLPPMNIPPLPNSESDEAPPQLLDSSSQEFHNTLTDDEFTQYFETADRELVPEYIILSPQEETRQRYARSVDESLKTYSLSAFGETYTLDLRHNTELLSPGCIAYHMGEDGPTNVEPCITDRQRTNSSNLNCYYHGTSRQHNGSVVALANCFGLDGVISIPEDNHDLVIKPLKDVHKSRTKRSTRGNNPHIVIKRKTTRKLCAGYKDIEELKNESGIKIQHINKRSTNELHLEMLLVGDKTVYKLHGSDSKHFLLTLANVAASRLLDPTLGIRIILSVVKVQVLQTDQSGLQVVEEVNTGLNSFCQWQEPNNPSSDSNPQHYDIAVLLTDLDLQQGSSSFPTGLATRGGVCRPNSRCAYVQDTGVDTGMTLAHEIGHLLGMLHDGTGNSCTDSTNIMSSAGATGENGFKWSTCSRDRLLEMYNNGALDCMKDSPGHEENIPTELPGILYSRDEQCEMWLGPKSRGTTDPRVVPDLCKKLVCTNPNKASTGTWVNQPTMDGVMCGNRKYCIQGKCENIPANGPQPVDGGWSSWSSVWSPCSRSCGGGVRVNERKCDNPKPRVGGQRCTGVRVRAELCNVKACPGGEHKFKEEQCAATNSRSDNWVPFDMIGAQECQLMCTSGSINMRRTNGASNDYQDGTTCTGDSQQDFYRCLNGQCQAISCDGHTDSNFKFDKCGICGGVGNTCTPKTGTMTKGVPQQWATIATLPKGSTGVKLENKNEYSKMTVVVNGKQLFNDNPSMPSASNHYSEGGVNVYYRKAIGSLPEKVEISGPTLAAAEAQVYTFFGDAKFQPDIEYVYHTPSGTTDYQWKSNNGKCTVECGGGYYEQEIYCTRKSTGAQVEDRYCNIFEKPDSTGSSCNTQSCAPTWFTGDWGQCSVNCGGGSMSRVVECIQKTNGRKVKVDVNRCSSNRKPADTRQCNSQPCAANWSPGQWSACSLTCGRGMQTRTVECQSGGRQVGDSNCQGNKPTVKQICVEALCDTTTTGSACKDTETNCASYDSNMCVAYGGWAKSHCALTCSFCSKTGQLTAIDPGLIVCKDLSSVCNTRGVEVCTGKDKAWASINCARLCSQCEPTLDNNGACKDTENCAAYGTGICSDKKYEEWVKEKCPKYCGICSGSSVAKTTAPSGNSGCSNKLSTCSQYEANVCTSFGEWAKINCAKMCGFCGKTNEPVTSLPPQSVSGCQDAINNCAQYGQNGCQGDYVPWAKANCPKFCGFCDAGVTTEKTTELPVGGLDSGCKDADSTCASYGSSICTNKYQAWAEKNCKKMCGKCGSSCKDISGDCSAYGKSICTGQYKDWATQNCAKLCGHC